MSGAEDTRGQPDAERVYPVDHLVAQRYVDTRRQFRVRWAGYGAADDTWEDETLILDDNLIAAFEAATVNRGEGWSRG